MRFRSFSCQILVKIQRGRMVGNPKLTTVCPCCRQFGQSLIDFNAGVRLSRNPPLIPGSADLTPDHRPASSPHKNPPYSSKTLCYGADDMSFSILSGSNGNEINGFEICHPINICFSTLSGSSGSEIRGRAEGGLVVKVSVSSADRVGVK